MTFKDDSPLQRVRRHDLRHAATTAWLNAGVPLKTAPTWSGHRTASVLLDTYLGVIKGDDVVGLGRFESLIEATWSPSSRDGLVTELPETTGD